MSDLEWWVARRERLDALEADQHADQEAAQVAADAAAAQRRAVLADAVGQAVSAALAAGEDRAARQREALARWVWDGSS